jgi:hypothetical protein
VSVHGVRVAMSFGCKQGLFGRVVGLNRMQEARCDALGSDFDALVPGGVRRDGGKDDGVELTTRTRPGTSMQAWQ